MVLFLNNIEIPKLNPIRKINSEPSTLRSLFLSAQNKLREPSKQTGASAPPLPKANYYDSSTYRDSSQNFKSTKEVSSVFRSVFEFEKFNAIQSQCFDIVMYSDINLLLSGFNFHYFLNTSSYWFRKNCNYGTGNC